MQSYIQFTDKDFAHYDPATAYVVGCIVNRRDFQDAVSKLRKKHVAVRFDLSRLPDDVKEMRGNRERLPGYDPSRPADFSEALHCGESEDLYGDVRTALEEIARADDSLWDYLLFAFVKFGVLPQVKQEEHIQRPDNKKESRLLESYGLHPPDVNHLENVYRHVASLESSGKTEEGQRILEDEEWEFTVSGGVEARGDRGDVVIRISPSASEEFIHDVVTATKGYRTHFRQKGNYGSKNAPRPHHLKEMIMLSEGGMKSNDIAAYMGEERRIRGLSGDEVRQLIRRARKMGF